MTEIQWKSLMGDFSFALGKKILIYGTGVIAHRWVRLGAALGGFQIVGCLDRFKVDGDIDGIPIITWDDVEEIKADILIIAAAKCNYREIYDRIIYRCNSLHLEIYGGNGVNLRETYFFHPTSVSTALYYQKSKDELKKAIEDHDAISFDLFDTLIMRIALEPVDIFDLVEERLKEKGIQILNFKKKRRAAEQRTPEGNIYQIYETLGAMLGFGQDTWEMILREEIQCEKDCIIPRIAMVELFRYAISLGKRVSILTDMYLPAPVIEDILSGIGIDGYEKLYVSCDYGTGKGNGLFPIYLETVPGLRCLHIGDNKQSDIEAAKRHGIDSYYIKSAYEMLKISNFRKCLASEDKKSNRAWIGLLISELFNDPFALYQSSGVVTIADIEMFGKVFFAPIVMAYLQKLYEVLKAQKYDGVLFGARDGYLFKKIYDSGIMGKALVPSVYYLTSRKLAFKSMMQDGNDVNQFIRYMEDHLHKDAESDLCGLFGAECINRERGPYLNLDIILSNSGHTQQNYIQYLKNIGIDLSGKYLFCDLFALGTSQAALNKMMMRAQDGFYFYHLDSEYDLSCESLYDREDWNNLTGDVNLLEMILTAPTPSVCDMKEGGMPVYAVEDRSLETLCVVNTAQKGIEQMISQYHALYKWDEKMDKNLAGIMFELRQYAALEGKASVLKQLTILDNLPGIQRDIQIYDDQC